MKKLFMLVAMCCLSLTAGLLVSCENEQKSSYMYDVKLDDTINQDPSMSMQFELNALPVIVDEMKKTCDQGGSSIIYKDTKSNADKRAKDGFAAGIAKLREGGIGSYAGLVVVLVSLDNETNKWSVLDKVTL